MPTQSTDPRTGNPFGPIIDDTSAAELDAVVAAAIVAAPQWADAPASLRVSGLRAIADALDSAESWRGRRSSWACSPTWSRAART